METKKIHCSACKHEVEVVVTEDLPEDAQANAHEREVVCLELGEYCTGSTCPLGAAEPHAMVARIVHNGLSSDKLKTVRGHCDACGLEVELALYGRGMAACLVCGTPRTAPT